MHTPSIAEELPSGFGAAVIAAEWIIDRVIGGGSEDSRKRKFVRVYAPVTRQARVEMALTQIVTALAGCQ